MIIEKEGIFYYSILSGKLCRYFDLKNIKDFFFVMKGVMDVYVRIWKLKLDVIFLKGGFVFVLVVIGGWLNRVLVLLYEFDMMLGLVNKIVFCFVLKIFVIFEEVVKYLLKEKVIYIGFFVCEEVLKGNCEKGLVFLGFLCKKLVIIIMGGSLGVKKINEMVWFVLLEFLKKY